MPEAKQKIFPLEMTSPWKKRRLLRRQIPNCERVGGLRDARMTEENEDIELFPGVKFTGGTAKTEVGNEKPQKSAEELANYQRIASEEREELLNHLNKITQSATDVKELFGKVHQKILDDTQLSGDGISLLQVRNHCLAEYLENLAEYCVGRCNGSDVSAPIDALVTNKCVVEKIKPLEKQLQYQITKYAEIEKGESQTLRANPAAMLQAAGEGGDEDEELVSAQYQAPKVAGALYPKAGHDAQKEARYARSTKARSKADALIDELAAEVTDDPLEGGRRANANREVRDFMKRMQEQEAYEEEHFVRIQRSKKDRAMMKKFEQMQTSLDGILDYGHIQSDAQREKRLQEKKRENRHRY